jgi:hypothetical protein
MADQSVVFAEEVKALIRWIADAQIGDGHLALAKEVFWQVRCLHHSRGAVQNPNG